MVPIDPYTLPDLDPEPEQPKHDPKRRWINCASGTKFFPLDPVVEDIHLSDIVHALSNLCRYSGHGRFYSVAEHSVWVCRATQALGGSMSDQLWALLHDATEAYLVDIPSPIKRAPGFGDEYRLAEGRLSVAVAKRFGLHGTEPDLVKTVDQSMIAIEAPRIFKHMHPDWIAPEPHPEVVKFFDRLESTTSSGFGVEPGVAEKRMWDELARFGL